MNNALLLYIESVLKLFHLDFQEGYKVVPIIVTARENYYLTDEYIKSYNVNEFKTAAINNEL